MNQQPHVFTTDGGDFAVLTLACGPLDLHASESPSFADTPRSHSLVAVRNLRRLRALIAVRALPLLFDTPPPPRGAERVRADLELVGASVFSAPLSQIVTVGECAFDLLWDETLFALVDELEADLHVLEASHGTVLHHLASYVLRAPGQFRPTG